MKPLYISFYTTDGYATEAVELQKTLEDFGLEHLIRSMPPFSSWLKACAFKPLFIGDAIRRNPDRPIIWLDADARVRKPPTLFETLDCDFAAHWKDGKELLSGTLYFGPTDGAKRIVDRWNFKMKSKQSEWDQRVLQEVVQAEVGTKIVRLPAPYTLIFDSMAAQGPAVIEHMQASRRLRH